MGTRWNILVELTLGQVEHRHPRAGSGQHRPLLAAGLADGVAPPRLRRRLRPWI